MVEVKKQSRKDIEKPEKEKTKFTRFIFNDSVYHVGEHLLFRETNKTQIVGEVLSIHPQNLKKK
jgi:hypothetical protein